MNTRYDADKGGDRITAARRRHLEKQANAWRGDSPAPAPKAPEKRPEGDRVAAARWRSRWVAE